MMVVELFNKLHVKKHRGEIGNKEFSCDLKIKQSKYSSHITYYHLKI